MYDEITGFSHLVLITMTITKMHDEYLRDAYNKAQQQEIDRLRDTVAHLQDIIQ